MTSDQPDLEPVETAEPAVPDPPAEPAVPEQRRAVVRNALAIAMTTGVYAVSYGAIGVTSGLSVAQTCALSLVMFTGGSQFAFVGVLGAGGSPISAVSTALLLGARNTFYGVRLATLLGLRGSKRLLGAHAVIDESTAMAIGQRDPRLARLAFWLTAGSIFALWNAGTLLGAVAGSSVGDPRTYGLDAAAPAAFVALLWPRLVTREARLVAVAGTLVAVALVPFAPAGLPVIAAGAVAVVAGLRRTPRSARTGETDRADATDQADDTGHSAGETGHGEGAR